MTCDDTRRLMTSALDGALDAPLSVAWRAHLDTCPECAADFDVQQMVAAVLAARPDEPVHPGFTERVMLAVTPVTWIEMIEWRQWTLRFAPVAAVLLLVAVLLSGFSSSRTTTVASVTSSGARTTIWSDTARGDTLLEAVLTGQAAAAEGNDRE